MAIRPGNLIPSQRGVRKPEPTTQPIKTGNLVRGPLTDQFGGAEAVTRTTKRAPYGKIRHVGKRGF